MSKDDEILVALNALRVDMAGVGCKIDQFQDQIKDHEDRIRPLEASKHKFGAYLAMAAAALGIIGSKIADALWK